MTHRTNFGSLFSFLPGLMVILTVLATVCMAVGVLIDARRRTRAGLPLQLLPSWAWAVVVLYLNLPAFGLYWVVHYSTLARDRA